MCIALQLQTLNMDTYCASLGSRWRLQLNCLTALILALISLMLLNVYIPTDTLHTFVVVFSFPRRV